VGEDQPKTSRQRVTVAQAAEILGITVEAVRGRIKRKTLGHERHSGTVYVLLHADQMPTGRQPGDDQTTDQPQSDVSALISAKDETIEALREQLEEANERDRENRRIIAALTSRIPAIEAPQEASEDAETVEEAPEGPEPHSATGGAQEDTQRPRSRPWWRRIIGG
jgi:hypothetical protein